MYGKQRSRWPTIAFFLATGFVWQVVAQTSPAQTLGLRHHPAVLYRLPSVFDETRLQRPLAASFPVPLRSEQPVKFAQMEQPAPDPDPESGEASSDAREGSEPTTLGTAPDDYGLQFLREGTVLLEPGQWQFDFGLIYALDEDPLPVVLGNNVLENARIRRRTLVVPFAARLGVTKSVQAFVNAPVGWGQTEFASSDLDLTENVGGIGDVSAGFNVLLEPASCGRPDIVLTLGMVAPTGNDAFGPTLSSASLGNGFWSALADIRFIHSYDPVVFFWGGGYRWQFRREVQELVVDPGDEITYQLGVGFAVNERITLSSAVFGSVFTETEIEGRGIPKTILEPIRMRWALTTVTERQRIIEPFVTFGLTPDATSAELGVVVTLF